MSKISVIVPIYNAERHLNKCIKSILNQTFNYFELILVNDGSEDNSLYICNKYSRIDSRVKVINKCNEGSIATRRRGIDESESEYIIFVDADDWIKRNTLEILNNEILKNQYDVIVFNMYKTVDRLGIIKKKNNSKYFLNNRMYEGDEIRRELASAYLHGHPFPAGLYGKLYKKIYLKECGNYLSNIKFLGEDLFYNLEIFLNIHKVKIVDKPLYYYRAGGFTSKYMPYFFNDIINGYKIQKQVINDYYQDSKESRLNGSSIMLLNTFRTSLGNLFLSGLDETEIKEQIAGYIENVELVETTKNKGALDYFDRTFLDDIDNKNINSLYSLGKKLHNKLKLRRYLIRLLNFI